MKVKSEIVTEYYKYGNTTNRGDWNIGIHNESGYYYPFKGTIDLKHSYMKINGHIWWTGTQPVKSTSSDYDFTKDVLKGKAKKTSVTKYFKYTDWTQPVLTSNYSSADMWLEDPNKSGAVNSSDQSQIETWGTSAMKNFGNVYLAMDSNTSNVFTLGASNATQDTYTSQTYDVCDVCFPQNMKITHLKVVCKFQSGYHCALRRVIVYAMNDDGTINKRLFNKSGSNDNTTFEGDIGTNKTKRLRFCFRPDWNNGSYSCQIQEITMTAQKAIAGTSSDNSYSETAYTYKIFKL